MEPAVAGLTGGAGWEAGAVAVVVVGGGVLAAGEGEGRGEEEGGGADGHDAPWGLEVEKQILRCAKDDKSGTASKIGGVSGGWGACCGSLCR